jgi:acetolactate synthase-1/2/3 large subunit
MGTSLSCTHQAFKVQKGQRVFSNIGFAPMGYGLPAAIGAWFATGKPRIICLHGDGGLQMNLQELQTLVHYKVPVKLFVINNREYVTIKHTQNAYFGGRIVGADAASGYSAPDFVKVAEAYGLPTETIPDHRDMRKLIRNVLDARGAIVCNVNIAPSQPLVPLLLQHKTRDGKIVTDPIERMTPYLPEDEFKNNMLVAPLED